MIVGLTGGIGSGKSEAAHLFAELGVPVTDTDQIAHALTAPDQPALQEIAAALGADMLNSDGSLNRARLRQHVFDEADARRQLEAILHPRIRERAILDLAGHSTAPYQILVVPLLFEGSAYTGLISRSLVIDCPETQQIQRTMARSQLNAAEIKAIMAAQLSRSQRLALADDVIENMGSLQDLHAKVLEKHEKYINTCIVSQSIS